MNSKPKFAGWIVLCAASIGACVGLIMSLIYNELPDVSVHLFNAVIAALYFSVIGGLIALARWQRRQ